MSDRYLSCKSFFQQYLNDIANLGVDEAYERVGWINLIKCNDKFPGMFSYLRELPENSKAEKIIRDLEPPYRGMEYEETWPTRRMSGIYCDKAFQKFFDEVQNRGFVKAMSYINEKDHHTCLKHHPGLFTEVLNRPVNSTMKREIDIFQSFLDK